MAQILWGKLPPKKEDMEGKGGSETLATYTGLEENSLEAAEEPEPVEVAVEEPKPKEPERPAMTSTEFGEMMERIRKNLAEQPQWNRRPVEEVTQQAKSGENPKNKQQDQVVPPAKPKRASSSRAVTSGGGGMSQRSSSWAEIHSLAERRMRFDIGSDTEPLVIASGTGLGRTSVLLPMMTNNGSAAVVLEAEAIEEAQPQTKPQQQTRVIPVQFPLSKEQQLKEKFFQATGVRPANDISLKEMFEPGWSIAGLLSPTENAWRVKHKFSDGLLDAEFMVAKAKAAVRDFLHRKRPLPGKNVETT